MSITPIRGSAHRPGKGSVLLNHSHLFSHIVFVEVLKTYWHMSQHPRASSKVGGSPELVSCILFHLCTDRADFRRCLLVSHTFFVAAVGHMYASPPYAALSAIDNASSERRRSYRNAMRSCYVHNPSVGVEATLQKLNVFTNVCRIKWSYLWSDRTGENLAWMHTGHLKRTGHGTLFLEMVIADPLADDIHFERPQAIGDYLFPPPLSHSCREREFPPGVVAASLEAPLRVSHCIAAYGGDGLLKALQLNDGAFDQLERVEIHSHVEPTTLISILECIQENGQRGGLSSISISCSRPIPASITFSKSLFVAIARCCPNLEQLDLGSKYEDGRNLECDLVDITNILSPLKKLEILQLDMEPSKAIRDEHFDTLKAQPFEYVLDPVFPRMRLMSIKCVDINKCMAPLVGWAVGSVPETCYIYLQSGMSSEAPTQSETSDEALNARLTRKREAAYAAAREYFGAHSWRKVE